MSEATNDLPNAIKLQADRIFEEIESAGSMILAVKSGAKAHGFVLGIACCHGLSKERCELLSSHFDRFVENRLRSLTIGM